MPESVNQFEMRRLEALSNTIFGVAMTLLAYNLPKGQILDGPPSWSTISAMYQLQVLALLISFVVRRLAGERWTAEDDAVLLTLLDSKTERILIARRLKRSFPAIQTRINILRKRRELARTRLRTP
jgi:hypothetical protein